MQRPAVDRMLPAVFRRALPASGDSPLDAVLDTMVELHRHPEAVLAGLDGYLNPRRTPVDGMVPYLAGWLDLDFLFVGGGESYSPASGSPLGSGLGWLRELVAVGAELAQWRGTRRGLRLFLETATGVGGFEIDDTSQPTHLRVAVPEGAAPFTALVERIVAAEKPVHLTHEVVVASASPRPAKA